jgi:hypothetical protein
MFKHTTVFLKLSVPISLSPLYTLSVSLLATEGLFLDLEVVSTGPSGVKTTCVTFSSTRWKWHYSSQPHNDSHTGNVVKDINYSELGLGHSNM